MHGQITGWLAAMRERYPLHFAPGVGVLEVGSRNVNGSARDYFDRPAFYCGIDANAGPGVDVQGVAHELLDMSHSTMAPEGLPAGLVDVAVSTEALEHDPFVPDTLRAMVEHLRPGGLLLVSCGSRRRPPHELHHSPRPGHYGGKDPDDLLPILHELCEWQELEGVLVRNALDTLVWGVRV